MKGKSLYDCLGVFVCVQVSVCSSESETQTLHIVFTEEICKLLIMCTFKLRYYIHKDL